MEIDRIAERHHHRSDDWFAPFTVAMAVIVTLFGVIGLLEVVRPAYALASAVASLSLPYAVW